MMRLTHFDPLHKNEPSSLQSTAFDTKEYLNTREKIRKTYTLPSLTAIPKSYERIKNTRTGCNSPLPVELDDVPESCVPLYANEEQRELYNELTRYANHPKMTVKDILTPFSHPLLMEQKYKRSDLIIDKLAHPTKMKFLVQLLTKIEDKSRKTYEVNILCNDVSLEYLLYEAMTLLNFDCQRFREYYGRDNQNGYGVIVHSTSVSRNSSRPHINLLIVYDCGVLPDIRVVNAFKNAAGSTLFTIYLTLVNTPEIRLFNYVNLHPEEDITWSTPIVNLSDSAKKCLLSSLDYTPVDSDREWNNYMASKAYKWSLIDSKTPFRETRTRPHSFISKDQCQVRLKRYNTNNIDYRLHDTVPEIEDILTQVIYGSFGSSKLSSKRTNSPIPRGPKQMSLLDRNSSPSRDHGSRDSSRDSNRSYLDALLSSRHKPNATSFKEEVSPMEIDNDTHSIRDSLSPSVSSTSSSLYEESSNRRIPSSNSRLEKSIHDKSYERVSSLEREDSPKRRAIAIESSNSKTGEPSRLVSTSVTAEPIDKMALSSSLLRRKKRPLSPTEESVSSVEGKGLVNSPKAKNRRLISPQVHHAEVELDTKSQLPSSIRESDRAASPSSSSRDPRVSALHGRDPRLSISPSREAQKSVSPPPPKQAISRDPRKLATALSSNKSAEVDSNNPLYKKTNTQLGREQFSSVSKPASTTSQSGDQITSSLTNIEETKKKKKEEEMARKRAEEENKKKVEEERKKKAEAAAREKEIEEAKRREEKEARKKAEEETRKKVEEEARKKAEEEAKKREDELVKKIEDEIRNKKEEEIRKKIEEEITKKKEEEIRKRIEQEVRKKIEEEMKKSEEENFRKRIEAEMKKVEAEKAKRKEEQNEKKGEDNNNAANDDALSDFEKALEKIHMEFQAALQE